MNQMNQINQKNYNINNRNYTAIEYAMKLPLEKISNSYATASLTVIFETTYYDDFNIIASYCDKIDDDIIKELIEKKCR